MKEIFIIILLLLCQTAFTQNNDSICCNQFKKIDSLQQIQIELLEARNEAKDSIIVNHEIKVKVYKKVSRFSGISLFTIVLIVLIL